MGNKKNLPNIPIYIGDWERDCNVLSLESEAAWMRIVFKLWTKGKQNSIKIPTKSLQNLWRCTPDKITEILEDLIFNEICEIKESSGFVEFTCRRFVKENKLSKIRSRAAKGEKSPDNSLTNPKQTGNKRGQNHDNDNDNENENEVKYKNNQFGKFENLLELREQISNAQTWKETVFRNTKEVNRNLKFSDIDNYIETFFKVLENDGEEEKTLKDFKKHFSRWLIIEINKNGKNINKTTSQQFTEAVNSETGGNFSFS